MTQAVERVADDRTGTLHGRVAIVTGAGRGLGRSYAIALAREGAKVVVNDAGVGMDGAGRDTLLAEAVVNEIKAFGGSAVANAGDISTMDGAGRLVRQAVDTFGGLHVVVNNAGILRDQFFHRMQEPEWDAVVGVHLKGHFTVLRQAVAFWHPLAKSGVRVEGSVINTTSASGTYLVLPGQTNYAAAKGAIASLSLVAAAELERIGVRVNAIAPGARTRMTEDTPGPIGERMRATSGGAFDEYSPDNVAAFVAFLAAADCPVTGKVFAVRGGEIREVRPWSLDPEHALTSDRNWTVEQIGDGFAAAFDSPAALVDSRPL